MIIANNIASLTAYTSLNQINRKLEKSTEQLSTGLRINSASDDAAGLAVSEKMRTQISGLDTALKNSQEGISLLQTAESAMSETNSILQRIRELILQASNDSLTSNDRQSIQLEINELKQHIDNIADTTEFNDRRILDGSSGATWSSSDSNVKADTNGGLTYTDRFGQKISSEGNYRVEVTAEPGQAQVQKSALFDVGYEEVVTTTKTVENIIGYTDPIPYEININEVLDAESEVSGDGWKLSEGVLTITGNGKFNIVGNGTVTNNKIVVSPGVSATIFLENVNIQSNDAALNMSGATVDLYLKGNNTLRCIGPYHGAGIQTSNKSNLTISSAEGDFETSGTLNAIGAAHAAGIGGACSGTTSVDRNCGNITIKGGTIIATGGSNAAGIGGGSSGGGTPGLYNTITIEGGNVTAKGGVGAAGIGTGAGSSTVNPLPSNNSSIVITGGNIQATGGNASGAYSQGAGIGGGGLMSGGNIQINNNPTPSITARGYIETGETESIGSGQGIDSSVVTYTNIPISPARTIPDLPTYKEKEPIAETEILVTENLSANKITLAETSAFYNSDGAFLLENPQTVTIIQGDGQSADITLFGTDTIYDIAEKINNAIANDLGQGQYTAPPFKFCSMADGTPNTSESVKTKEMVIDESKEDNTEETEDVSEGITVEKESYNAKSTMLIRSVIPGKIGELYFSGNEDLLNVLGFNTIQESKETIFTASIYDAHSGINVINGVKTSEAKFPSIIPPKVDIEINSMAGISVKWDEETKRFIHSANEGYTAMLHLKDNAITFQIGVNKGEDFTVNISDISSQTLGISNVNVLTSKTTSRALGSLDIAINKLSLQRAKIGTYENALEDNIENLTIASVNLTTARSRILDTDMAKVIMNFVKFRILNQSGISMLAQTNQLPQSVLSLLQ